MSRVYLGTEIIGEGVPYVPPFNAIWSGSSLGTTDPIGISTTGSLFRQQGTGGGLGADITVNLDGTFTAVKSEAMTWFAAFQYIQCFGDNTMISGSSFGGDAVGVVTFDKVTGFSGSSIAAEGNGLETLDGQLRYIAADIDTTLKYGDWITLT